MRGILSLVGELRSHLLSDAAKTVLKKKKKKNQRKPAALVKGPDVLDLKILIKTGSALPEGIL